MKTSRIIEEANELADRYNLKLVEIDKTDNIINLKLSIDNELFIQIYGNAKKNNLNLSLIFKRGDCTVTTLKVANITITLLITLMSIYLLRIGNQYKHLFKSR